MWDLHVETYVGLHTQGSLQAQSDTLVYLHVGRLKDLQM